MSFLVETIWHLKKKNYLKSTLNIQVCEHDQKKYEYKVMNQIKKNKNIKNFNVILKFIKIYWYFVFSSVK